MDLTPLTDAIAALEQKVKTLEAATVPPPADQQPAVDALTAQVESIIAGINAAPAPAPAGAPAATDPLPPSPPLNTAGWTPGS